MTSSPPRLLLTGATGFIGSRFALYAHRAGLDVRVTGRVETPGELARLQELREAGIAVESGLLQDPNFARTLVQDRDAVIHLAAAQHESHVPDSYFRAINVDVTRALLEASRDAGVRRFVYGSSIGIYGAAGAKAIDETTAPNPQNVYGRSKLEAEQVVRSFAGDLEGCIVRISEVYGPGDMRLLKLFRAIDRGRFVLIGNGDNQRQPIHVNDLIRGLLLAAEHPAAVDETFVFAGPEVITTAQTVDGIARALRRRTPSFNLPMLPFLLAAVAFEMTLRPLGIEPPLHRRRLDFFRKSFVFATAKSQRLLGFQADTDFRTGAADTASWYRSQGLLPQLFSERPGTLSV
jgi:nucleoside-diphosphate-sugar epimerase